MRRASIDIPPQMHPVCMLLFGNFQGTKAYEKMQEILMKTGIVNDVKRLSPEAETSCLEGFHSTLNQWHPKIICFSWLETFCR